MTDPRLKVTQTVHGTPGGTLATSRTDALNRTTTYTHDGWGRLTGITYPAGGSAPITLTYDAEGRLTQSVDGTGTRTYSYDSWGRKLTQTDPMGNTVATYDDAGRILTQTDPSARQVSYSWDTAGRLSVLGDAVGNAQYAWTADGKPDTITYPNGAQATYGYDGAGRPNSVVWSKAGVTIVGYSATYDDAGRLSTVTEQPSGDVTTFGYDDAGRLTSENRTGVRAYTSAYRYDSRGNRQMAARSEGGVVSHNGTYSYDDASRLTQVVDAATGQTELYGWNDDNTLASYPGPIGGGYTRLLSYDEEGRLTAIQRDFGGGNVQLAYEYAYGYDGGRRWRKDHTANVWTWYPCGVACSAGELVEAQSDLTGNVWTTSAQYLKPSGCGGAIVRRNGEFHLWDLTGTAQVITDGNGNVLSSDLYDRFGVKRFSSGSAATPWREQGEAVAEEGLLGASGPDYLATRDLAIAEPQQAQKPKPGPNPGPKPGPKPGPGPTPTCPHGFMFCREAWQTKRCRQACAKLHSDYVHCCEQKGTLLPGPPICICKPRPSVPAPHSSFVA